MQKRTVSLCALLCVLFGALLWRTMAVGRSLTSQALQSAHTRTLQVAASRGKIYDRFLQPLAPSEEKLFAAVAPCAAAMQTMQALFGAERAHTLLQSGAPVLEPTDLPAETEFVRTFSVPVRYGETALAEHLIGTTDAAGKGTSGIEKAFDDLLQQHSGALFVRFPVDANGRVLPGLAKEIVDENFNSAAGVALTLETEVQKLTEDALKSSSIESGCAAVMDAETGEIRAMASVPGFDRAAPQTALDSTLSPFTNKALNAYSVGSVFKPLVAAVALESGVSEKFCFTCTGSLRVGDAVFRCYNGKAHGRQTMREALQNSCNTYFIRLFAQLDVSAFLSFCRSLGFGNALPLCDGLSAAASVLPDAKTLRLPGERANFAFGQGELLCSPVQLLSVYQVLATGTQAAPTVLRGTVDETGALRAAAKTAPVRRLSEQTVRRLQKLLHASACSVCTEGEALSLSGKTGTAQSGSYVRGKEVCRTWFAGFYPAASPRYVVVVLNENGVSGAADCAPVFQKICAALEAYTRPAAQP